MYLRRFSLILFAEQPDDQRDEDADNNHRGYGEVNLEVWFINDNIAGQPSQRDFTNPGPQQPGD